MIPPAFLALFSLPVSAPALYTIAADFSTGNAPHLPVLQKNRGAHYHHERYDGKGYPEGKAGEDIPLVARIICVADSFDAMNSDRVYRKRLKRDRIISEIEKNKGLQFDPRIADIMLDLIRSGRIPTEE